MLILYGIYVLLNIYVKGLSYRFGTQELARFLHLQCCSLLKLTRTYSGPEPFPCV